MAGTTNELERSEGRRREWVDDALTHTLGLDPRRFRAGTETERLQAFETFQAGFEVEVDELSGERTVKARSRTTGLNHRRIQSAEVAALAVRVEILISDAQERLYNIGPILAQPDTQAIEASRRVISAAFERLVETFALDPWPDVVDLLFHQLLEEDDHGRDGALGTLGELTGLLEPHRVRTPGDEVSYVAYRTVVGHVQCAAEGWEALTEEAPPVSFSQASGEIVARSDCIEQYARDLLDKIDDDCLDVALSFDEADGPTVGVLVRDTIRRAGEWRAAARHGRAELLAVEPFVEMLEAKFQQLIESTVFVEHLDDEKADEAKRLARRVTVELTAVSAVLGQLEYPGEKG